MGTEEYISQSNLSNKVRSKKLEISHTKWKHTTRKHGYGHYGFKSLTMKEGYNESSKVPLPLDLKCKIGI